MKAGRLTWDATTTIELRDAEGHHFPTTYKPCAWAVTDHEAGPPYKPCAWTVTDHVMDINSSVRLASALAEPCTASSEHMRSLCSNARPCGARSAEANARRYSEYEPCG